MSTKSELARKNWQRPDSWFDDEHPEDTRVRRESISTASRHFDTFFSSNVDAFRALVLTYADRDAEDLLAELRESFWVNLPVEEGGSK